MPRATTFQVQETITLPPAGPGLHEATRPIAEWVTAQPVQIGLLTVFVRHTSASLLIQENASPDVLVDMANFFSGLAPEQPGRYRHADEGPDDMPAHLRAALTQTHLSIPVAAGRMQLGTWQGIFLFEHRRAPHRRELVLHLIGG